MKCCKCGPRTHKTFNGHNVLYGDNYLLISSPAFLSLLGYKSFMLRNGIAYYSSKKTCIAQAFLLSFKTIVRRLQWSLLWWGPLSMTTLSTTTFILSIRTTALSTVTIRIMSIRTTALSTVIIRIMSIRTTSLSKTTLSTMSLRTTTLSKQ
jgi:hypothetical protein